MRNSCKYCGMPPSGDGDDCCKAFALDCCRAALSRLQKELTASREAEAAGRVKALEDAAMLMCAWCAKGKPTHNYGGAKLYHMHGVFSPPCEATKIRALIAQEVKT